MNYFDKIVGQTSAKRKLSFYLDNYQGSGVSPHMIFIGPKGMGKTMIAKEYARNITKHAKPKKFIELNCSSIKSLRQIFDDVIVPHVMDKDVTILFDEASELPEDVSMMLLTMLNPNKENKNSFSYDDFTINIDFSKQTFLFATTEAHKINSALMDRLTRVDLEDYTFSDLAEIMSKNLEHIKVESGVMDKVSSTLRGNARQAQKMANDINCYIQRKSDKGFSDTNWEELIKALGILPLGLNQTELRVLKVLSERKEVKLTNLAAILGMSRSSVQRDAELYLQRHNLMTISLAGRSITAKGQVYLKQFSP